MGEDNGTKTKSPKPVQILTKEQLWLVEKLVGKINNYSVMAAVESARTGKGGKEIMQMAEQMQSVLNTLDSLLFMYVNNPDKEVMFAAGLTEGESMSDKEIRGKIGEKLPEMLLAMTKSLEKLTIYALLVCFQKDNRPLCISFEELRKNIMSIYNEFAKSDVKRSEWYNAQGLELAIKPLTPKSFDFFSFNLNGQEIVEEIGYIHKIYDYNSIVSQFQTQKNSNDQIIINTESEEVKIDHYFDLYEILNCSKPQNSSAMCIVVLQFVDDYFEMIKDVQWKKSKILRVAFPVDCFNYPFTSKIGKSVKNLCDGKLSKLIKDTWQWRDGHYFTNGVRFKIEEIKQKQLHFIDWPLILEGTKN